MTRRPTTRRVTAADVARSLGLSRATVGFVLNDTPGQSIPDATRQRVLAEAERMGYRPHRAAQTLASGRSRIVLLQLPDWPIGASLRAHLDAAAATLDEAGYAMVATSATGRGRAPALWETLNPDVVVSLLPFGPDELDRLHRAGVRVAVPARPDADVPAYAAGPRLQVAHLVGRGCRAIAFAGSADPRLAGLVADRRALAAATHADLVGGPLAGDADLDLGTAADVVGDWLRRGVDGVAAYNDDVAALVAGAATRAGRRLGDDLAVVGHDDSPLASLFVPSLTSVRVDTADLGRYLARLALATIDGTDPPPPPDSVATLVRRESA